MFLLGQSTTCLRSPTFIDQTRIQYLTCRDLNPFVCPCFSPAPFRCSLFHRASRPRRASNRRALVEGQLIERPANPVGEHFLAEDAIRRALGTPLRWITVVADVLVE